jgi:hypothetical protein
MLSGALSGVYTVLGRRLHIYHPLLQKSVRLKSGYVRTSGQCFEAIPLGATAPTSMLFGFPCNKSEVAASCEHSSIRLRVLRSPIESTANSSRSFAGLPFLTSSTPMTSYSERSGRLPSFEVVYRFLSTDEGGRNSPPHQHTRWDFVYEDDDPSADGIWMIWPEFIAPDGQVLPEGVVPSSGRAFMYIVNLDNEPYHRKRIDIGTKGAFVEGTKKVAVCEVVAIHALAIDSQR